METAGIFEDPPLGEYDDDNDDDDNQQDGYENYEPDEDTVFIEL